MTETERRDLEALVEEYKHLPNAGGAGTAAVDGVAFYRAVRSLLARSHEEPASPRADLVAALRTARSALCGLGADFKDEDVLVDQDMTIDDIDPEMLTAREAIGKIDAALVALDSPAPVQWRVTPLEPQDYGEHPAEAPDALREAYIEILSTVITDPDISEYDVADRLLAARPAVGAPADAGLRADLEALLASMVSLSKKDEIHPSARAAYDYDAISLRGILFKYAAPTPSAQAPGLSSDSEDIEQASRDPSPLLNPASAKRVFRCKGCGKEIEPYRMDRNLQSGDMEHWNDWKGSHVDARGPGWCGPVVEEVQP